MTGTNHEAVTLDADAVDQVLKELETAQRQSERTLSHDKVRPSEYMAAKAAQRAYVKLVEAHPNYELTEEHDG